MIRRLFCKLEKKWIFSSSNNSRSHPYMTLPSSLLELNGSYAPELVEKNIDWNRFWLEQGKFY
jgi:hypothetical protein